MGLISMIASRLLADEIKAKLPTLTSWVAQRAVNRLPVEQRDRFREEWEAHLDETTGDVSRLLEACGFLFSAYRTTPWYVPEWRPTLIFRSLRYERDVIEAMFQLSQASASTKLPPDAALRNVHVSSIDGCIPRSGLLKMRLLAVFRPTRDWAVNYGRLQVLTVREALIRAERIPGRCCGPRDETHIKARNFWLKEKILRSNRATSCKSEPGADFLSTSLDSWIAANGGC